jgi:hypothetical protein
MRRCLRSIQPLRPLLPLRPLHTTPPRPKDPALPEEVDPPIRQGRMASAEELGDPHDPLGQYDDEELNWNYRWRDFIEDSDYAMKVNESSWSRWKESQDPRGHLEFLSLGREFRIPMGISQGAHMSLQHQRELRAYYRKMMYEMPQFRRTSQQTPSPPKAEIDLETDFLGRIRDTVPSSYEERSFKLSLHILPGSQPPRPKKSRPPIPRPKRPPRPLLGPPHRRRLGT